MLEEQVLPMQEHVHLDLVFALMMFWMLSEMFLMNHNYLK